MDFFSKIWKNIKIQPDIWFFYGFLLTFTLSVRKALFYFPIQGTFNEYTAIFVYISDIFLFLAILVWIIFILSNTLSILSSIKLWINALFHNLYLYIPLFLVFLSFFSIFWSQNQTLALFRSIKLLEFYFLYIYTIFRIVPSTYSAGRRVTTNTKNCSALAPLDKNVPRGTFLNFTGWNISIVILILVATIQSVIAIIQSLIQHSLGLFWLKESLIGPNVPGVAKIILHGDKFIRSCGLFPHPNILGGFLLLTIILTLLNKKLFHVEQLSKPSPLQGEGAQRADEVEQYSMSTAWNVPRGTLLLNTLLAIQLIALFLTLSKSAILGLLVALFYIYVLRLSASEADGTILPLFNNKEGVGVRLCSTWNINCIVGHIKKVILALLIFFALIVITKPNIYSFFIKSLNERILYLNVSRGTILANPILGIGNGQFVWDMQKYQGQALKIWQFQPVHNVFLLILSELGVIGLGLFMYWIYKLFHAEQNAPLSFIRRGVGGEVESWNEIENNSILKNKLYNLSSIYTRYFKGILLGFTFIMLFDHYFWDIWQGQVMLWMVLGVITGLNKLKHS